MMRLRLSAVMSSLVASVAVAGAAFAQEQKPRFEEAIVVTATPRAGSPSEYVLFLSGPVQVPGRTLAAGSYLFKFPSGTGAGRVIQIQIPKGDRSTDYVMFHTIEVVDATRSTASDAHRVTFREPAAPGAPPAIREWFVPGRSTGWEFVYKK